MKLLAVGLFLAIGLGSHPSQALKTVRKLPHYIGQVEHLRTSGLLTALIAKELCSCLFVQNMAANYPEVRGRLNPKAISECMQRAQIPFLNLIFAYSRVQINVFRLPGKTGYSSYLIEALAKSPLADLAPSPDMSLHHTEDVTLGNVRSDLVINRAEAALHDNPRFGCRMQDQSMIEQRASLPLLPFPVRDQAERVLWVSF
jgi:hypothetical protein